MFGEENVCLLDFVNDVLKTISGVGRWNEQWSNMRVSRVFGKKLTNLPHIWHLPLFLAGIFGPELVPPSHLRFKETQPWHSCNILCVILFGEEKAYSFLLHWRTINGYVLKTLWGGVRGTVWSIWGLGGLTPPWPERQGQPPWNLQKRSNTQNWRHFPLNPHSHFDPP